MRIPSSGKSSFQLLLAAALTLPGASALAQDSGTVAQNPTADVTPPSSPVAQQRSPARDLLPSAEVRIPLRLPQVPTARHPSELKQQAQGLPLRTN